MAALFQLLPPCSLLHLSRLNDHQAPKPAVCLQSYKAMDAIHREGRALQGPPPQCGSGAGPLPDRPPDSLHLMEGTHSFLSVLPVSKRPADLHPYAARG